MEYGRVRHDLTWIACWASQRADATSRVAATCKPHPAGGWIKGRAALFALGETSKGRKRTVGPTAGGEDGHWTRKDWESVNGGRDTVDRDTRWFGRPPPRRSRVTPDRREESVPQSREPAVAALQSHE